MQRAVSGRALAVHREGATKAVELHRLRSRGRDALLVDIEDAQRQPLHLDALGLTQAAPLLEAKLCLQIPALAEVELKQILRGR